MTEFKKEDLEFDEQRNTIEKLQSELKLNVNMKCELNLI